MFVNREDQVISLTYVDSETGKPKLVDRGFASYIKDKITGNKVF